MFPGKLNKGDSLGRLFDLFNQLVDYLQEIRLVAGRGVSISKTSCGQVIHAERQAAAMPAAAPAAQEHPFDVELVNNGTDENPEYYVRIFNSALPDSPYAGVVFVGDWEIDVPVTELPVNTQAGFFVALDVTYTGSGNPPFSLPISVIPYGSGGQVGYLTYRTYIAEGKLPNVASRQTGDISVIGRWI